ncbi:MAG TPA: ABC transporter ATP-binding protein [Solirubrobacteraceae bacterium]|nr:ABC transporter ATP-binding protein [Solirubrobacteraceae bacterium]
MRAKYRLHTDEKLSPSSMWSQLDVLIGDKRGLVFALGFLSIIGAFLETGIIAIVSEIATDLVSPRPRKGKHGHTVAANNSIFHIHASIHTLLWAGLALTIVRLLLQYPNSTLPARIAADVQRSVRVRVFGAFTRASWAVQSRDREGLLQENMTSQVYNATGGALQATALLSTSLTFIILMGSAVALSPIAAGCVFVLAVLMFNILRPIRAFGKRQSRTLSQALVQFAGGVAESNRLAEESHAFGVTHAQYERVSSFADFARDIFYRTQVIIRLVPSLYSSLIYVALIIALYVLDEAGVGHAASLGAVILLLYRSSQAGQTVQSCYQGLQQSLPFIERLRSAEQRYLASEPADGERALSVVHTLAFEEVGFSYNPGRPVLSDVSFTIEAGETIGVIGPSGAGKSTLVQLLLRLRDPCEGSYLLNDVPVQEYLRADWHRLVSYVPQEPRLMHASVTDNIRFYRDIDGESIERAARLARIHDDITGWSEGYDTIVGPRADAVSGGQQQRICLARALAARPQVLVLDEPTSALDPYSEKLIGESLDGLRSELTLIIVAHRMSTLDSCDRVMVILDGRLVAFDTKAYLQENDPYYRSAVKIATGTLGGVLPETL